MNFWSRHPGLKLVIPFILGIIASIELGWNSFWLIIVSIVLLAVCAFSFSFSSYKNRKGIWLLFFLTLFFIGFSYTSFRTEKNAPFHYFQQDKIPEFLEVKVIENLLEKKKSYRTVLEISHAVGDCTRNVSGKILAYIKQDSTESVLEYGDKLLIRNGIKEIASFNNPDQFDYKNYLNLNQINYTVYLNSDDYELLSKGNGNPLIAFSQRMRKKLYNYLQENGVEGKQLRVASALLLGYKENLDKELQKSYSSAGAMHVLAVSGLHVGILYFLLSKVFQFLKKIKHGRYVFTLILVLCLWFYAIMTGLSASVMRASTMFSFIIIGKELLQRKASIYNTLAVSAVVLMVVNPFIVYQVGFQLSYVAVVGIVYLQPKLNGLYYSKHKIIRGIWSITCVSVAAQVATFPLSLHYFHQFPTYFFISNLVVIPAAFGVFYLGVFLFVLAPFGGLSLVVGKLINGIVGLLNEAVYFTEKLPNSVIGEIEFTVFETYLLYAIIVTFLFAFFNRQINTVYLSLGLVVVFCGFQVTQQYIFTQQKFLTFYSINKQSALEYTQGNSTYFISTKDLQEDWSMMQFNVNNHWNSHNILHKVFLDIDSLPRDTTYHNLMIYEGIISTNTLSIWIFDSEKKPVKEPDYTWIKQDKLKGLSRYLKTHTPKTIVFDSSVPSYKLSYFLPHIDTSLTKLIVLDKKYYKIDLE